jgi:hypothetical protein
MPCARRFASGRQSRKAKPWALCLVSICPGVKHLFRKLCPRFLTEAFLPTWFTSPDTLIFPSISFPSFQDIGPPGSWFADWNRMNVGPEVSRYHIQRLFLAMAFDKVAILGNEMRSWCRKTVQESGSCEASHSRMLEQDPLHFAILSIVSINPICVGKSAFFAGLIEIVWIIGRFFKFSHLISRWSHSFSFRMPGVLLQREYSFKAGENATLMRHG